MLRTNASESSNSSSSSNSSCSSSYVISAVKIGLNLPGRGGCTRDNWLGDRRRNQRRHVAAVVSNLPYETAADRDQCRLAGQINGANAADSVVGVRHLLLDLEIAPGAQALHDEGCGRTSRAASTAKPPNGTTLTAAETATLVRIISTRSSR